jgi:hypothetical protein
VRILILIALASCTSRGASHVTLPTCVRAEAASHDAGVQEFSFDADGDLIGIVELDNAGKELARTRLEWSPTGIVVTRSGALSNVSRGVLGAHGELVEWTTDAGTRKLRWDGTFAPTTTAAAERFAFESYYHLLGGEFLLPLDTAERGVWPRMRAFVFDGTVTIDGGAQARYEHGHQVSRTARGVTVKTSWSGDAPVEQIGSDGEHRAFSVADGHLTKITGGPDVAFHYNGAGNLTHVRTDHGSGVAFDVDVSPCR